MFKKIVFTTAVIFCFMNTQCEEDVIVDDSCDYITIISESKYPEASSEGLTFINAEIQGDCLLIDIGASGCNGDSWEFELIDSGAVAESEPEQRFLKLDFDNDEACLASFERTISFDLKPIRISESGKIILNLEGVDKDLIYSY